jgi:hypothetical protein
MPRVQAISGTGWPWSRRVWAAVLVEEGLGGLVRSGETAKVRGALPHGTGSAGEAGDKNGGTDACADFG